MWNPYRCCFEISNSIKWNISKVFNQEAIRFWCFHVCVLICKYRMNRDQKKTFPIQFESEKFGVYVICEYERTFDILLFAINVLLRPHLIFRKCHVKILIMLMRIFSDLIDILFKKHTHTHNNIHRLLYSCTWLPFGKFFVWFCFFFFETWWECVVGLRNMRPIPYRLVRACVRVSGCECVCLFDHMTCVLCVNNFIACYLQERLLRNIRTPNKKIH